MNSTKPGCNDLQRVCNGNAYSFGAVIETLIRAIQQRKSIKRAKQYVFKSCL